MPQTSTPASKKMPQPPKAPQTGAIHKKGGKHRLECVPLKDIEILKGFNPRGRFDKAVISDLAVNMKRQGQLQTIVVRPHPDKAGKYLVVAGECRYRAMAANKEATADCTVREDIATDEDALAIALAENNSDGRHNLNVIEEGAAFKRLGVAGWTPAKIATATGVPVPHIRRCLQIMDCPDYFKERIAAGELSVAAGVEIAASPAAAVDLVKEQIAPGSTALEVRRLVKAAVKRLEAAAQGADDDSESESDPVLQGPGLSQKKSARQAKHVAAGFSWRATSQLHDMVGDIAHTLLTEEVGVPMLHTLRGAVAALMWFRGQLEVVIPPELVAQGDKGYTDEHAEFDRAIKAEADRHARNLASGADADDPDADASGDEEDGEDGGED